MKRLEKLQTLSDEGLRIKVAKLLGWTGMFQNDLLFAAHTGACPTIKTRK